MSNIFYSYSLDKVEKLPKYESNNFRLIKGNNPKMLEKPIIPIPIADLNYWKLNNYTSHSHINSQKFENYDSSGYNKLPYLNKNEYFIPEVNDIPYYDVPLLTQKLQPGVYTTNYPRIINANQGISNFYNTGPIIEGKNNNGLIDFIELKNDKNYENYLMNENNNFIQNDKYYSDFNTNFLKDNELNINNNSSNINSSNNNSSNNNSFLRNINEFEDNNIIYNPSKLEMISPNISPVDVDKYKYLSKNEVDYEDNIAKLNNSFLFSKKLYTDYIIPQEHMNPNLFSRNEIERSNVDLTTNIPYHNNFNFLQSTENSEKDNNLKTNHSLFDANTQANTTFINNTNNFRNNIMQSLMQKRNSEMYQLIVAPIHTSTSGK